MKNGAETDAAASFQLGGQALIEGVMMRSPHYVAGAVAAPPRVGPAAPGLAVKAAPSATAATAEPQALPWWLFLLTVLASLGIGVLLFVALPNVLADWTLGRVTHNLAALNVFEGLV